MKITYIAPVAPYRGGIAHFATRLAAESLKQNQVQIINFSRLYPSFLFPGKTQLDLSKSAFEVESEQLIDSMNPVSWVRTASKIKKNDPDAVVFHYWHPFFAPAYGTIAARLKGKIPLIAICHNVVPHDSNPLNRSLASYFLSKADGFILHSRTEEEPLQSLSVTGQVRTAFHPLYDQFPGSNVSQEEARRRLKLDKNTKLALYFGLIRPYKGVDVLIEAVDKLSDIENLKILAVGEIYADREKLTGMAGKFPANRFELIDSYVPNDEVAVWFRAADLIVLPYRSATQSGIVPIAYACERPVIVTRTGGLPEVVVEGETGHIVEPGDPLALAEAIRTYFQNLDFDRYQTGIRAIRKTLGWGRYLEILTDLADAIRH